MKKLLLLILLVAYCLAGQAQRKVAEYYSEVSERTFDITAVDAKKGTTDFDIECPPMGDYPAGFTLKEKNVESFCESLTELKIKYEEWSKLAKERGLTEYDKPFDIKFKSVTGFFQLGEDWYVQIALPLNAYFLINNGDCLALIPSLTLKSSTNRYITSPGFNLSFASGKDIDNLIVALRVAVQNSQQKTATDELFK